MPYLISYSYKLMQKMPEGHFSYGPLDQEMAATRLSPAEFVLRAHRQADALEAGDLPPEIQFVEDIEALLSVVEITDAEHDALADVL